METFELLPDPMETLVAFILAAYFPIVGTYVILRVTDIVLNSLM